MMRKQYTIFVLFFLLNIAIADGSEQKAYAVISKKIFALRLKEWQQRVHQTKKPKEMLAFFRFFNDDKQIVEEVIKPDDIREILREIEDEKKDPSKGEDEEKGDKGFFSEMIDKIRSWFLSDNNKKK